MAEVGPVVVLIEDEPQMRRFLRAALTPEGYQLIESATARDGLAQVASRNPRLVLLDLSLPDRDGLEVTREIREWTRVPIIVISARGRDTDKVAALDAGADDYVTKPFAVPELLARMRVALRHAAQAAGDVEEPVVTIGELRVDRGRHTVTLAGEPVHLTPTEFRLLSVLVRYSGRVLTHRQLLKEVWGVNAIGHAHYLRVYMAQLRHKLERDPARPHYLQTELGVGYRLRDD
jgi:two-component system KDP operon response regulator KdpE